MFFSQYFYSPQQVISQKIIPGKWLLLMGMLALFSGCAGSDEDSNASDNQPPVANAGNPQVATESETVYLDGSLSLDQDASEGDSLRFTWSQIKGTPVTINGPDQAKASFTVPDLAQSELMIFQLKVVDAQGAEATDQVEVTVFDKTPGWDNALDFTASMPTTVNVSGDLPGKIEFIQSSSVATKYHDEPEMYPALTTDKDAFILFTPLPNNTQTPIQSLVLTVGDRQGNTQDIPMKSPYEMVDTDQNTTDGRPKVLFSKRAWSAVIPWNFVHKGMSIRIRDNNGRIADFDPQALEFHGPAELVSLFVDIGMLTSPQPLTDSNEFTRLQNNRMPSLTIDYFQKVPVAKITVGQYLPVHWQPIVMPDGSLYETHSTYQGAGAHSGDMRQQIGKGLISTGIFHANIGHTSSVGGTESKPKRYFRLTVIHKSTGVYADESGNPKVVQHGLSGGGGQLTLYGVTGNEFTHEYGHDHGLGHYPDGIHSIHSVADGWGYDFYRDRMIGNLMWQKPAGDTVILDTISRPPFEGLYRFNTDAMAGGDSNGSISQYTTHTARSLRLIQERINSDSYTLNPDSLSGYDAWDDEQKIMRPVAVEDENLLKPDLYGVPVMTLVGFYDPEPPHDLHSHIYPAMYGNWGNYFSPETTNSRINESNCHLLVVDNQNQSYRFNLEDKRLAPDLMNQFHVNLPSNVSYTSAEVVCATSGKPVTLASVSILPPSRELSAPLVVGKEYGYEFASERIADFSAYFSDQQRLTMKDIEEKISLFYGRAVNYSIDGKVVRGELYRDGTQYYIAKQDNALPPSPDHSHWYYLGDAQHYLSTDSIGLNELSINYAQDVLNGESGVYFYVPVDGIKVVESDAPAIGGWYQSGDYSAITVAAKNNITNEVHQIVLRGNRNNDSEVLNRGTGVGANSLARIYFVAEDNPGLPAGAYEIDFTMYAAGWHNDNFLRAISVKDTLVISSD